MDFGIHTNFFANGEFAKMNIPSRNRARDIISIVVFCWLGYSCSILVVFLEFGIFEFLGFNVVKL